MTNTNEKRFLNEGELTVVNGGMVLVSDHEIFEEVRKALAAKLGIPIGLIGRTSNPSELGADSLDVVDVVQGVEKRFGIRANTGLGRVATVGDLCNRIIGRR